MNGPEWVKMKYPFAVVSLMWFALSSGPMHAGRDAANVQIQRLTAPAKDRARKTLSFSSMVLVEEQRRGQPLMVKRGLT